MKFKKQQTGTLVFDPRELPLSTLENVGVTINTLLMFHRDSEPMDDTDRDFFTSQVLQAALGDAEFRLFAESYWQQENNE